MRRRNLPGTSARPRPGKILVLFALLLPPMLGMVGIVIDGGILTASYRQTQNAADAAALAAALDLYRGASSDSALATANTFLINNGVSGVTLTLNASGGTNTLNIPPSQGPYAVTPHYVEAVVTKTVTTSFIQMLQGTSSTHQVTARAVAGYEPVGSGEGAIVLNPNVAPGISVQGSNTQLVVDGTVVVNSNGKGTDQFGIPVNAPNGSQYAIQTQSMPSIIASDIQTVGGIDILDNVRTYDPAFPGFYDPNATDRPLFARAPVAPDPLLGVPTPDATNGVQNTFPQYLGAGQWTTGTSPTDATISNNETVTFSPGIYRSITINGGTVTFNPGIYVLGAGYTSGNGNRLSISGGTVTGNNVMIYNAGSDYTATNPPDAADGDLTPNPPKSTSFGGIGITGGTVTLTPYSDPNSPFKGILLYQRRWNNTAASIAGKSSNISLTGTIYAKWANFAIAGQGRYNAQFVVGTMSISGNALVTINATGKNFGRANLVFLVE